MVKIDKNSKRILEFIKENPSFSSKEIYDGKDWGISYATLKRRLSNLVSEKLVTTVGRGRGQKYFISPTYDLFLPIDLEIYFERDIDDREVFQNYNFSLIKNVLEAVNLFSSDEIQHLQNLQQQFLNNISNQTESAYDKEFERLAIDLSWKSSQIEGNTYSLLETEKLLKEKETASGKSKDEAVMLLNHKDAIDYIINNPTYIDPISVSKIEDIHSLLVKELNVERNIRKGRVGISGTNYKPLDNEFQISEALKEMCSLVNSKENIFEKALLLLVLISYIQPFSDGNKRTARIICNAILIKNNYCPISFRTVDSLDYKKSMLLFYEQNNLIAMKELFLDQFEFAVKTYF